MRDKVPFQKTVTNKKGPTSRLKAVLKQFLYSLPERVCGPTCIMWRQRFRKVVCVKHIPSLDYKNINRRTEPFISALDKDLTALVSESECRCTYTLK